MAKKNDAPETAPTGLAEIAARGNIEALLTQPLTEFSREGLAEGYTVLRAIEGMIKKRKEAFGGILRDDAEVLAAAPDASGHRTVSVGCTTLGLERKPKLDPKSVMPPGAIDNDAMMDAVGDLWLEACDVSIEPITDRDFALWLAQNMPVDCGVVEIRVPPITPDLAAWLNEHTPEQFRHLVRPVTTPSASKIAALISLGRLSREAVAKGMKDNATYVLAVREVGALKRLIGEIKKRFAAATPAIEGDDQE